MHNLSTSFDPQTVLETLRQQYPQNTRIILPPIPELPEEGENYSVRTRERARRIRERYTKVSKCR